MIGIESVDLIIFNQMSNLCQIIWERVNKNIIKLGSFSCLRARPTTPSLVGQCLGSYEVN